MGKGEGGERGQVGGEEGAHDRQRKRERDRETEILRDSERAGKAGRVLLSGNWWQKVMMSSEVARPLNGRLVGPPVVC